MVQWKAAIYRYANVFSSVMRGEPYRLIVPIAVKRNGSDVSIVEPTWTQCRRSPDCVVYFPVDVDAIIYLKELYDFWREAEVRCDCGDATFCRVLGRCAAELWKPRRLGPDEVAAALPQCVKKLMHRLGDMQRP
jgi:hypothetical protein